MHGIKCFFVWFLVVPWQEKDFDYTMNLTDNKSRAKRGNKCELRDGIPIL